MLAFGAHQAEAFPILREAFESGSDEARRQAIAALGRIGNAVPEARQLLWDVLRETTTDYDPIRLSALSGLGDIGFLPEDIPTLAAMIPGQTDQLLVRYLPEQIARAIRREPEAMKPHLHAVEALLQNADPAVRFSAACALAETRGAQDPEILRGLAAGLVVSEVDGRRREATGENEHLRHIMAVETLQRLGPAAKALLPELQAFANTTPSPVIRELALRTIAAIDREGSQEQPAIQSLLAKDAQRDLLLQRLESGSYSTEDLHRALQEPRAVSLAATRLGQMGAAARSSLPELHRALAGKDEATRDEILASIRSIDPDYVVDRVPREPLARASLAAQLELETQRASGDVAPAEAASLESLIDRVRIGNTSWYTQSEIAELAAALRQQNPRIYQAFAAKPRELHPESQRFLDPAPGH